MDQVQYWARILSFDLEEQELALKNHCRVKDLESRNDLDGYGHSIPSMKLAGCFQERT